MDATATSMEPFRARVAVPLPITLVLVCASTGKLAKVEAAVSRLKVVGLAATAGAFAVTSVTPTAPGMRTYVSAKPLASLVAEVVVNCAPLDAWNVTAAPTTASPDASRNATRNDTGRSAPGGPVWLSP